LRRGRVHLCGAADEIDSLNDELGREKRSRSAVEAQSKRRKHEIGELRLFLKLNRVKRQYRDPKDLLLLRGSLFVSEDSISLRLSVSVYHSSK
jgi:hypothetical protein